MRTASLGVSRRLVTELWTNAGRIPGQCPDMTAPDSLTPVYIILHCLTARLHYPALFKGLFTLSYIVYRPVYISLYCLKTCLHYPALSKGPAT